MLVTPSRQGGFARNDAESAYPELWAGLTGAWVPALGGGVSARNIVSSGIYLEDLSGFSRAMQGDGPSTIRLENEGGAPALLFNATTFGYLESMASNDRVMRTNAVTVVVHKQKTDGTNRDVAIVGSTSATTGDRFRFFAPAASGDVIFDFGGNSGSNRVTISGLTIGNDIWIIRAGSKGMQVWQNGILVGDNGGVAVSIGLAPSTVRWNASAGTSSDICRSKVCMFYDRELSEQEILFLSRNPLAPFTLKQTVFSLTGGGGALLEQDIEQSILFAQTTARVRDLPRSASSTLTLTDDNDGSTVETAESELTLTDFADGTLFVGDVHHLSDNLNLTDSAEGDNASVEEPSSGLGLVQTVSVLGPIYVNVQTIMGFEQAASGSLGVPWLPIAINHPLGLVQSIRKGYPISVTTLLNLTQAAYRKQEVQSTLTLTGSAASGRGYDAQSQSVNLSHQVQLNAVFLRSISHGGFLRQSLTYFEDGPCARKQYNRFQGEGEGEGIEEKPLLFKSDFVLESLSGPKQTVRLRSPEMDDRDRLGMNRINRETRGGELNVYADPAWPKTNTLLVTVIALKQTKVDELQQFFLTTLGQQIKLQDWSGRSWIGVITTPGDVATEDGRNEWTISFEFEGEPYPGQAIDDRIAFQDSVLAIGPIDEDGDPGALALDQSVDFVLETP